MALPLLVLSGTVYGNHLRTYRYPAASIIRVSKEMAIRRIAVRPVSKKGIVIGNVRHGRHYERSVYAALDPLFR